MTGLIQVVDNTKLLDEFIMFVKTLYQGHPRYVFPIFRSIKKELRHEVLTTKKYTAILCVIEGSIRGRLMYTIDYSKSKQRNIGFYSFFDLYDDELVAHELIDFMEKDLLDKGIDYSEGTYAPYDPDTRRGILIMGFDKDPTFMTSYNYEYYGRLLEACGYEKAYDTVSLKADICEKTQKSLQTIETYFEKRYQVAIDPISFRHINRDIDDIFKILHVATTEINYQNAPSREMIEQVAVNLRFFINPNLIIIAREKASGDPVGFCLVLPDFNQIFKKTQGKIKLFPFLFSKRYITRTRGIMQYVVPKYQNSGLIGVMFKKVYDQFESLNITEFEAGTILEENLKSMATFYRFGGEITKTYRIFGKDLTK